MTLLGYKCNMNDLQAALLIPQLKKLEINRQKRAELSKRYDNLLVDSIQITQTPCLDNSVHAHHLYTCLLYTSPSPRDRTRSRMPSSA